MILFIDTTNGQLAHFAIIDGGKVLQKKYRLKPGEHGKTLNFLEDFLKRSKINHKTIKKIVVNAGPGSFSGVRVGVTIAEALAFAWGVTLKAVKSASIDKVKK